MLQILLLGPPALLAAGLSLDLGPAKQRLLLAALAVDAGFPVSTDTLIERMWGGATPSEPRNVLQSYVSRIRRVLERAQPSSGTEPVTVHRSSGGYRLAMDADLVDLHRFRGLVERARAGADDRRRAAALADAVGLWRSDALAGLPGDWAARYREGLHQLRLAALVDWADAELTLDHHEAVVARLSGVVAQYPLTESLIARLMQALSGAGRDAEALAMFGQARRRIGEELGTEPGPLLRALHTTLVRGERIAPASAAQPRPAQLPPHVRGFVGRTAELAELDRLMTGSAADPGAVPVVVITGTAGVGKTTLAVRWAHRELARYPDGQLYVDLRGYDPEQPLRPADALAGMLRSLGVPDQGQPADLAGRTALFRTLVAGRRMLVLLDNAASVEQVRDLLPGTPPCAVLVTSRDRLGGLVARHGACRVGLGLLSPPESVALLRLLLGDRVEAEPHAAAELADQCARLPLALRVAAELAAVRPGAPLADLTGELADRQRRLARMDAVADPRTAVSAVFSWSCQHLSPGAARTFRLTALHPGLDFDGHAAAALAGVEDAEAHLAELIRAHLLTPVEPQRYGMHDLLRTYAAGLVTAEDDGPAALGRLFDHYLGTAIAAVSTLYPAQPLDGPGADPAGALLHPVADPVQARRWLDEERPNLVGVSAHATAHGRPGHVVRLAAVLNRHLDRDGHYADAQAVHGAAMAAAAHLGDPVAETAALVNLGAAHWRQGRYEAAAEQFQRAVTLARTTGDQRGEARALTSLGIVSAVGGDNRAAIAFLEPALALFQAIGYRPGELATLSNLSEIHLRLSRLDEAAACNERILLISRTDGDAVDAAHALTRLGLVRCRQGRHAEAIDLHQQALARATANGDRLAAGHARNHLGLVHLRQGRADLAVAEHRAALDTFRRAADCDAELRARVNLGAALLALGRAGDAREHCAAGLHLAVRSGDRYHEANARTGLGHAYHALGDDGEARHHWHRAATLYTQLGLAEAAQVRALAAADARPAG